MDCFRGDIVMSTHGTFSPLPRGSCRNTTEREDRSGRIISLTVVPKLRHQSQNPTHWIVLKSGDYFSDWLVSRRCARVDVDVGLLSNENRVGGKSQQRKGNYAT